MGDGVNGEFGSAGQPASIPASLLPGIGIGTILAGKYRVDRILGAGGMGVVVAAHHLHLDEPVAIKFLLPEILHNREIVARFLREARAAIKIKSEHVARVTDVGTLDSGAPYMVMEFLDGSDLASWIAKRGPLSVEDTVEFVLQACEALAEAHVLKMVHRDLKPANLFVVRRADGLSAVRVLDFGISKMANATPGASGLGITKTTDIMGSPLYMAPEQMLASHDVDMRSDIWSLGVVIHEMITGKVPFEGESVPEVCAKILRDVPDPMSRRRPGVPHGLDRVVLRCLEKERARRYQNVAELANGLVDYGPKRARASAERITRIIQAAGLSQPPPPAKEPARADTKPIRQRKNLLRISDEANPSSPSPTHTTAAATDRDLGAGDLWVPRFARIKKAYVLAAAVVLAIVLAVVALSTRHSSSEAPPSATVAAPMKTAEPSSPPPPPPASPPPTVVPLPTVAPPALAPPATAGSADVRPSNGSHEHSQRRKKETGAPQAKEPTAVAPQPTPKSPPPKKSNRMLDLMDDRK